jgi:hypothetical protein
MSCYCRKEDFYSKELLLWLCCLLCCISIESLLSSLFFSSLSFSSSYFCLSNSISLRLSSSLTFLSSSSLRCFSFSTRYCSLFSCWSIYRDWLNLSFIWSLSSSYRTDISSNSFSRLLISLLSSSYFCVYSCFYLDSMASFLTNSPILALSSGHKSVSLAPDEILRS